jgi:hypothetical protein
VGKVLRSEGGFVVIDAGHNAGVELGSRVELLENRGVDLGLGEVAGRLERVATGEITAVGATRAQVRLDLDESAPVGAVVRYTKVPVPSVSEAPRPSGTWHARLAVRPFIALGATGFGDLSDVLVGYRFQSAVHLQLALEPLAVALPGRGEAGFGIFGGSFLVSWDLRSFEVGLGPGVATVNNATTAGSGKNRHDAGPGIAQVVRLGTVEGVNATVRGLIVADDNDRFAFASLRADIQAPVGGTTWLILTGAGGISQYALVEAGLRVLIEGNGTGGSLFLTPVLGYAGVQTDRSQLATVKRVEANGLSIGLSAEWRL